MKRIFSLIIIGLMIFSIVGCTKKEIPDEGQGITVNEMEYEIVEDINSLPEDLIPLVEGMKKERGFTNFRGDTYNYVVISSGEKPTGGYDISIKSVEDVEGIGSIVIEETEPEKGSMVTEALTYPYIILDMPMEAQRFEVSNQAKEELEYIPKEKLTITEVGTYVGQIDNNFIEITTEDGPGVFMISEVTRDTIESMKENTPIEFTYYKNENGQLVLTNIEATGEAKQEGKKAIGIYVGQIDPTSIEITIDGNPKAFRNYDMAGILEGISDGDKVEVSYTEENGQLMIYSLKKID